jgi:hypothetical protein
VESVDTSNKNSLISIQFWYLLTAAACIANSTRTDTNTPQKKNISYTVGNNMLKDNAYIYYLPKINTPSAFLVLVK